MRMTAAIVCGFVLVAAASAGETDSAGRVKISGQAGKPDASGKQTITLTPGTYNLMLTGNVKEV